jgi:thiamine biosynthesis lipoprotein
MGTTARIVLYAAEEAEAEAALDAAFARIAELDAKLSDYQPESELMRLCASAPHATPMPVSDDLWNVLKMSVEWSRRTDGAFDITVGPLSKLWRRARRQGELPPKELIEEARQLVGFERLEVDELSPQARLPLAGMRLDLGGIAKGFAADAALDVLRDRKLPCALVALSGDVVVGAAPPGEAGWRVGVAAIRDGQPPTHYLLLRDCGVSTSGDLWQYLEVDGVRYSHTLDPRTGWGIVRRGSATVVAQDGSSADALATAVCILGAPGLATAERHGAAALLLTLDEDDEVRSEAGASFGQYIDERPEASGR